MKKEKLWNKSEHKLKKEFKKIKKLAKNFKNFTNVILDEKK